jgi:hypothetical protein
LILTFVVAVASNALAGVSPHLDGDAGCTMACCQAARNEGQDSLPPRLCCKFECKQPAGTHVAPDNSVIASRHNPPVDVHFILGSQAVLHIRQVGFPSSPTLNVAASSKRFLETGTLLI